MPNNDLPQRSGSPTRQSWLRTALIAGGLYLIIGRVFSLPTGHVRAWRLAAWLVSGVVFLAHIAHERFARHRSARSTAWHAALGAAIGAFGLAVAGALHSQAAASTLGPRWLLALVLWPLITGVPAFVVALVLVAVLIRVRSSVGAR